jgi:Cof subfamily protein (haloacid dehalogenase superfamily)
MGGMSSLGPVRLVATDLDGTIVRRDGSVSARVVAALAAVEDAGLPVVFVTGRPPRWMAPVVQATGHRGVAVCANGALVYDLQTGAVLERFTLHPEVAAEVVRRLRQRLPGVSFAVERHESYAREERYRMRWDSPDVATVATAEELFAEPVAKLLARDETSSGDAMLAAAREVLGDLVAVTHSNPADCLLEMSAAGVTKASTLALLAGRLGIDAADVLAFGDQPNDLPLLLWAGHGYAMGGAHPELVAAVRRRTGSVDEDGVAVVLEHLLATSRLP